MRPEGPSAAFWRDRPVLVTGATGLQGGWLVRTLLDVGADVVALVRDWVPGSQLHRSRLVEQVRVVRGDVVDQPLLERTLGEYEIETVFHLAAQTIVPIAHRNPISTFESNVRGTWALLEACRRSPRVGQIIVASSDKAYGTQEDLPYVETHPLVGRDPYDVSKSCADLIAQSYAVTYDLPVLITRCGNLYGGGDLNWSRIVPGTIRSVIRDRTPLIRSDGKAVRDYFYVEDGAMAYCLSAERLADDRALAGEAFNFSNEEPLTVLEIVDRVLRVAGRPDLDVRILNEASGEIPAQYLDAGKARRVLGWEPRFTLEEGLERTLEWYRRFLEEEDREEPAPDPQTAAGSAL